MKNIINPLSVIKMYINRCLCNTEPWKIVTVTSSTVLMSVCIVEFVLRRESISKEVKKIFFKLLKKVPIISNKIKKELDTVSNQFVKDIEVRMKEVPYITCLPNDGWSDTEVLSFLDDCISLGDYDWKQGMVSGTVYYQNEQLLELLMKVYKQTAYSNPLHSDVFPGVCKMEAEVVQIVANLFHGGPGACGTMTSGGSESIMMACKAMRDYSIHERGINVGEIVLPKTAHPAFDKSALYLNMKVIHVPVDPQTTAVNIRSMERAITRNTVMLVGSMPNYPYGTADDIEAIAALGRKYNIPVHVDCCLGGFLTAFMPAAGYPLPLFDFSLPGVISMSVDPHKYGFTPKGASVVLYAEAKYRHYQYTITTDWPGGIYGSPTISGSRPGGSIAVCWATLMNFGFNGYLTATKKIISTTKFIEKKLREIEEIFLFGNPATSVIAIGSKQFHIYKLSEMLTAKGWNLNTLQFPSGIHLCVTHMHTEDGLPERFVKDVKTSIVEIMKQPDARDLSEGKMALYGVAQSIPDRTIVGDITCSFIDSLYFTPQQKCK